MKMKHIQNIFTCLYVLYVCICAYSHVCGNMRVYSCMCMPVWRLPGLMSSVFVDHTYILRQSLSLEPSALPLPSLCSQLAVKILCFQLLSVGSQAGYLICLIFMLLLRMQTVAFTLAQ